MEIFQNILCSWSEFLWMKANKNIKLIKFGDDLVLDRYNKHLNGLVQYCSNSIANTMELLHSCTKP